MTRQAKQYVSQKLSQALWVVKSIESRRITIERIVESILRRQRSFFVDPHGDLMPMRLRDIADDLSVHESTVSRAINEKYLQCRRGIFPLKNFFSGAASTGEGTVGLGSRSVKDRIRELVAEEGAGLPPLGQRHRVAARGGRGGARPPHRGKIPRGAGNPLLVGPQALNRAGAPAVRRGTLPAAAFPTSIRKEPRHDLRRRRIPSPQRGGQPHPSAYHQAAPATAAPSAPCIRTRHSGFARSPRCSADLEEAAREIPYPIRKVFLADGDALIVKTPDLLTVLDRVFQLFPACRRVTTYGCALDVLGKSHEELCTLREHGLEMVYLGAETGSDRILTQIKKGVTAAETAQACQKLRSAGIKTSMTLITGIGGVPQMEENAVESARLVTAARPEYLGLLTLTMNAGTELTRDYLAGRFQALSPLQILEEQKIFLEHVDSEGTVLRSNHISNYVALAGTLNRRPPADDRTACAGDRAGTSPAQTIQGIVGQARRRAKEKGRRDRPLPFSFRHHDEKATTCLVLTGKLG